MRLIILFLLAAMACAGALTADQQSKNAESFEYVWRTVQDKTWDKSFNNAHWKEAHDELLPKLKQAQTMDAARKVFADLIGRLHLTHFGVIPGDVYSEIHGGSEAMDVRLIDGKPILVTGKHKGWQVDGTADVVAKVEKVYAHSTIRELMTARAVANFAGDHPVTLSDGNGREAKPGDSEFAPRGEPTVFGNLPTQYVWIESRQVGKVGYFAFNIFLDPGRLIPALSDAIESCKGCTGFVIDLRGNPGGIGGMAMGMAGFFVDQPGQLLGTMQMRDSFLKFAINPRTPQFTGKLAILVDGLSASTSEIFSGGLQDLKRARIFGSLTAGAALPSVIERLPNGDAFQYAIANYTSKGGEVLEGKGVAPDEVVHPTRAGLLRGEDEVLDRALHWLKQPGS